ncbi:LPS assembly lipoprotein LptE [Tuwongella immobilis]|uniref:ABC-type transport auxiliary lipoprotein component domain-containing protein n=1 Tax=Tuwongella immobilis TaxID=692036 RepID=A0A6C2YSS0_9BACT|nr:LPS assembly lipoprotein LptE [Tuwongella immobilis]VIP04496.1 signal peptide protein : Uncharacterized protein OS=Planctomyces maris DSM 8797 GN=PM8797T_14229 PE=4 SV=1: LptE [Tuwongella immobilis]VTS06354.1 signal peptide protein : Uncharacterized protein OS=Planctomyces maris DSM 8797 GN=PM8797T_14229 PE=4 SV=1: LptE [Tuwongella immobilis]
MTRPQPNRRQFFGWMTISLGSLSLTGCLEGGHLSVLGYTTQPNYDLSFRTVYVPIFKNTVFQTGPYRGMEFTLTRAVIREIEAKTPYKIVSNPQAADTELLGTVVGLTKNTLNTNQENEVREGELLLMVDLVWRDLRTGKVLSNSAARNVVDTTQIPRFDPTQPQPISGPDTARPVRLTASGRVLPEAGESSTTGLQMAIDRMALQIIHLMEKPWNLKKEVPTEAVPPPPQ